MFAPDVNKVMGTLPIPACCLDPEIIGNAARGIGQRIKDMKYKFLGLKNAFKYQKDHPFGI